MDFYDNIIRFFRYDVGEEVMAWFVLILSIILFLMRITKDGVKRQGTSYIVSNTLFLAVCVIEIIHSISIEDLVWFCIPDKVGWLWTIVNFFLLGGIVYNQIMYLKDVIDDVFAKGNVVCDVTLGLFSWVVALVCLVLCGFFFKAGISWVIFILGIMQFIQSILIFRSYGKNIKGAFFAVFVYLLGTIGTVLTLMTFLGILILVIIGIAIVCFFLAVLGNDSGGKKGRIYYNDGTSEEATVEKGLMGETYYKGKDSGNEYVK